MDCWECGLTAEEWRRKVAPTKAAGRGGESDTVRGDGGDNTGGSPRLGRGRRHGRWRRGWHGDFAEVAADYSGGAGDVYDRVYRSDEYFAGVAANQPGFGV